MCGFYLFFACSFTGTPPWKRKLKNVALNTLPLGKFRKNSYSEDILSQKLCLLSCCDPFSYKRFSSTTDFTEKPCTIIHFFLKKHLGKVALVDVLLTKSLPVSKRTS